MPRKSPKSIVLKPLRCRRVYPIERTRKNISQLKTVGVRLSREQAIHLARVLLAASQDWDELEITAYRFQKRLSDGAHNVTVTAFQP